MTEPGDLHLDIAKLDAFRLAHLTRIEGLCHNSQEILEEAARLFDTLNCPYIADKCRCALHDWRNKK